MSFTGSPARKKGAQSPLKGVQSPLGLMNRVIKSPSTPYSTRKKQHHEDDKTKFSLASSAENCDPNAAAAKSPTGCQKSPNGLQKFLTRGEKFSKVSDGCQKQFDMCQKTFIGYDKFSKVSDGCQKNSDGNPKSSDGCPKSSDGRQHVCKSRRCGANYPDWASANLRPQPRKFLVAKRIERPNQQEGMVCKCCEKKSKSRAADSSADTGRKCACIASQQLRASQEEFLKANFEKKNISSGEEGESSVEAPIENQGKHGIQDGKKGFSEMDRNREKIGVAEPQNGNRDEKIEGLGDSEFDKGDTCFNVNGNAIAVLSSRMMSSGQGTAFSNENPEKFGFFEPPKGNMDETIQGFEVCGMGKGNTLSDGNGNTITLFSPGRVSNDEGNSFSSGNPLKIGFFVPEKGMMHEKIEDFESSELAQGNTWRNVNLEKNGVSEPENGNMDEKMEGIRGSELDEGSTWSNVDGSSVSLLSPWNGVSPAPRRPKNELLAEAIGTIPLQGGGRVKHLVKAFESLLSLPDYESTEVNQARPLDRSIYNVSDIDQGKQKPVVGKSLKWALPGMQPKGYDERNNNKASHESYDDMASPFDSSISDAFDINEGRQRELRVGKVVNWALPGMLSQGSEERPNVVNKQSPECNGDSKRVNSGSSSETSCADFRGSHIQRESHVKRPHSSSPSHESCCNFKFFPVCQETASAGNNETRSVSSFGRTQSSSGSRRRSRKESLDSSGRGSVSRSGMQQWMKQLKVTSAQPFKLRTEQRGHMKREEFMKKVQGMLAEEEKSRIPVAQGLPWTTDEPEHLAKPPAKECTKPLEIKLFTEIRAVDRAEFDQIMAEKLNALEQQRLEEERLQKLAEEEEIKRLRKEMIPRAQPMPFFDRPFIPRRSSKSPTIPKEPRFHVPHHKRAKCISWNDFNVCQQ